MRQPSADVLAHLAAENNRPRTSGATDIQREARIEADIDAMSRLEPDPKGSNNSRPGPIPPSQRRIPTTGGKHRGHAPTSKNAGGLASRLDKTIRQGKAVFRDEKALENKEEREGGPGPKVLEKLARKANQKMNGLQKKAARDEARGEVGGESWKRGDREGMKGKKFGM